MLRCPACTEVIPEDSRFCGFCGFRLSPIPPATLQERARTTPPLVSEDPILLTRTKARASSSEQTPAGAVPLTRKKISGQLEVPKAPALHLADTVPALSVPEPAPKPEQGPGDESATAVSLRRERATDLNNRKCRRFPLKVEVTYTSEHNFFAGFMQNIGEGGLFVATHIPGKLGEVVEVTFSVPGLHRVCSAVCRVRWIREFNASSPDSIPGMGLQFAQLESDVRAAIDLFIEHREPIFYDD